MDIVQRLTMGRTKQKKFPRFTPGDTLNVHAKVKEGAKERIQVFQGVVLKIQGKGTGRSFTVRKISAGVGVERTFPFASPAIDKIELVSRGKVRRARLFYLRDLKGRAARLSTERVSEEERTVAQPEETAQAAPVAETSEK
ncbi:MAG: 50S ribosomal protein L19 [Bdellovibrionaceae bacterium]|nr:50S ribosomal protein L19 [Bdellovibrionales bacterium]MCB9083695.1 50S ribosomal protein L19 [Pseudobdellovibrionaceae bacterium]